MMILTIALAPGWIVFTNGHVIDFVRLKKLLEIFALDTSGLAGFLAFGGLLLAINRIEMKSHDSPDADGAVRTFILLRFRNSIQWAAVIGASTAPAGGLIWIITNVDHVDWLRSIIGVAVTSLALWTVLLLAVPSSGYFGLQSVAKTWNLNHTAFRRDMILQNWGGRWRTNIQQTPPRRWYLWHVAWRWLIIAFGATCVVLLLAEMTDEVKPDWGNPATASVALSLFLFNAYVGGVTLLIAGWLAETGITAVNRGWRKTGVVLKSLALFLGPAIAIATIGFAYLPLAVMVWIIAATQVAYVLGLLNDGDLHHGIWWPVRGMILNARLQSQRWAHFRWKRLDETLRSGLCELPSRERKRKEKEISRWHDRLSNFM
ncbi:hypothetical protein VUN82_21480 [Micrococcaceae bacterium Sec5.1]